MNKIVALVRVSTDKQDNQSLKKNILDMILPGLRILLQGAVIKEQTSIPGCNQIS